MCLQQTFFTIIIDQIRQIFSDVQAQIPIKKFPNNAPLRIVREAFRFRKNGLVFYEIVWNF